MAVKETFRRIYNEDLEKWVKGDTSGNFRKLLIAILQCNRSMNPVPDPAMCQAEAQALYNLICEAQKVTRKYEYLQNESVLTWIKHVEKFIRDLKG